LFGFSFIYVLYTINCLTKRNLDNILLPCTETNEIKAKNSLISGLNVMKNYTEIFMSYGQSDEFSFVFKKNAKLYNRRSEKILTNIVSLFTSSYVYYWDKIFKETKLLFPPSFDGRIILYPSLENLKDYFCWRVTDCHINNLYNTTFWALVQKGGLNTQEAHNKLKGTFSKDKNEILFKAYNINYNNEPEIFKKGSLIIRLLDNIENDVKKEFKYDPLLIKDDEFTKEFIESNKNLVVAHMDVINDSFWDKTKINFD
jgi:tRNA(His) guanylyltransferase